MAYIQPNSIIEFFTELGFDSNYENSLYFASESAKNSYFGSLTKITTAMALTYSREERGFVRVEAPISTLFGAGYMRFKNTSFENKWFYAFIKSVEYINNVTTQVNFEIDVMMTWMGCFEFNQCFIERQHGVTDEIGDNLIPENLNCDDVVSEGVIYSPYEYFSSYSAVIFASMHDDVTSIYQQGTFVPVLSVDFEVSPDGEYEFLQELWSWSATQIKEIFCIKIVPTYFYRPQDNAPRSESINNTKPYLSVDGYEPKNNKLYTYPYKYLEANNSEGTSQQYRYEYFKNPNNDTTFTFKYVGIATSPSVQIMTIPENYAGEVECVDLSLTMSDFPSIPWNDDLYKAYLAQKDSRAGASILSGALKGGEAGRKAGVQVGIAGAVIGALAGAISDSLADINAQKLPSVVKGELESNVMMQSRRKLFRFKEMTIRRDIAKIYDDYFNMFGYAQKCVGTPNINARTYYTYIQTKGCSIRPKQNITIPADDAKAIESLIDKGCRFWKNHTNIGNYELTNSTITA